MQNRFDEQLTTLLNDVSVPQGLGERIFARLKNETPGVQQPGMAVTRRLTVGFGFLTTALVLLMAFWMGMRPVERFSEPYVLNEAIRLFERGMEGTSRLLSEKDAPGEYPYSELVQSFWGMKWRFCEDFLRGRGVCYEIQERGKTAALLFVLDGETLEGVDYRPAMNPFSTAGCCASAWHEQGKLYVLVVKGDIASYREFLKIPRSPVA